MAKLYVYCPRRSTGAYELATAIGGERLRRFDGMDFWNKNRRIALDDGAVVVCWGTTLPEIEGARVLNSMDMPLNKFQEYEKMLLAKVPQPKMLKPDGRHSVEAYRDSGYVPRTYQHTGGLDLLDPRTVPDYYSYLETFVNEFRIHSFNGRSIRAGKKVPRDGFKPLATGVISTWKPGLLHPWVRSYDGGWKISYDGFSSTAAMRELAHKAVRALGLTFGAVDIGQKLDGSLMVLEVNTAPGIEGNTLAIYGRAIAKWVKKDETDEGE